MNRLFSLRFTPCGAVILALVLLAFSALPGALAQEDIFTATVKGGTLRLRELPGDNGRVLGRYPTGTLITVLADGEEYCRVRTPDGREGYMMKAFLTFENGLPPTDPAAEAALLTPHSWVETTRQAALDRGIDPAKPMLALTFDDGPSPATEAILDQFERFAPGTRERVVGRSTSSTAEMESYNPNYVGGDVATGANDPLQVLFRPRMTLHPYDTGIPGTYLCSSATPPGAGIHGMCGAHAAARALKHLRS